MRKWVLTFVTLSLLATLVVACGPRPTPEKKFRVGMVTDVGGIDDKSFNATSWQGMELAKQELGVEVAYLESQQQADYAANLTQFIDQGYDMIVTVGFLLGDDTAKFAKPLRGQL
jgi:basic membrane protein A